MDSYKASMLVATCALGALVFILFGLVMFPSMLWIDYRVKDMATWPTVQARIESATLYSEYKRGDGVRYLHQLAYRYELAGESHLGNRTLYGGARPFWRSEAAALKALPAVGSPVQVRVNPRKPSDSVITVIDEPAKRRGYQIFGLAVGLAGAAVMIVAARAWRRSRASR